MEDEEYEDEDDLEYKQFLDYCDSENDVFKEIEQKQLEKYIEDSI